jgi:hypothetical protein
VYGTVTFLTFFILPLCVILFARIKALKHKIFYLFLEIPRRYLVILENQCEKFILSLKVIKKLNNLFSLIKKKKIMKKIMKY